jgi:hypothetical protein
MYKYTSELRADELGIYRTPTIYFCKVFLPFETTRMMSMIKLKSLFMLMLITTERLECFGKYETNEKLPIVMCVLYQKITEKK